LLLSSIIGRTWWKATWLAKKAKISRRLKRTTSGAVGGKSFTAAVVMLTIDFNIQALVICDPKGRVDGAFIAGKGPRTVACANCFNTVTDNGVPHYAAAATIANVELRFMARNGPVRVPCTPD
jgi:hypothetical protein